MQTVFGPYLGALIFGATMFIGGLLAFLLPETNKKRIPETIAEANVFLTSRLVYTAVDFASFDKYKFNETIFVL